MDTKTQSSAGTGNSLPPQKPWERAGSSSGPVPFKPPSLGSTSDVVEASGTAKPGEIVSATDRNAPVAVAGTAFSRPVPTRPWEQQQTYGGGYGASYNTGYGTTGMYGGSSYGGYGGSYGGGLYGNSMYNRGGYGSSMYGGGMYGGGGGMYGGGMYNSGLGGPMGGYGGMGDPYGEQDPNNPYGAPSGPPNFWISLMRVMQGVVNVFGRVAMLIDQNTQALHMFMSAALQLFDRSGLLYGELARFVFRLLGIRTKPRKVQPPGPPGLPGPQNPNDYQNAIEGPKAPPSGGWDNLWGDNAQN